MIQKPETATAAAVIEVNGAHVLVITAADEVTAFVLAEDAERGLKQAMHTFAGVRLLDGPDEKDAAA